MEPTRGDLIGAGLLFLLMVAMVILIVIAGMPG
jgi:hypothetical protein